MADATREVIAGAVARGWCTPENEKKEMDTTLALAIVEEVLRVLPLDSAGGFCVPHGSRSCVLKAR